MTNEQNWRLQVRRWEQKTDWWDAIVAAIVACILFATTAGVGLYYWYAFVTLCPTGCGL